MSMILAPSQQYYCLTRDLCVLQDVYARVETCTVDVKCVWIDNQPTSRMTGPCDLDRPQR